MDQERDLKSPIPTITSAGEIGFACSDCGRSYKLKSSLRNHQKWECGKDPQFQCPYCVYRAKQKMHIGRHMERMHKERYYKVEGDKVIALDEPNMNCMDLNVAINMNLAQQQLHQQQQQYHLKADSDR
jgi:DNA-directed RNA polymerase subunit RPC12/RpoP